MTLGAYSQRHETCTENYVAIGGTLNIKHVRAHWDDILRMASSIKHGTATASLMLRKLGSYPQNGLALALRELRRIKRTLFVLDWLQNVELRRCVHAGFKFMEYVYLERAAEALRNAGSLKGDTLQQYMSPPGWEHNLTGDYVWRQNRKVDDGKFRPLRTRDNP
jgi:TnpA family transposase